MVVKTYGPNVNLALDGDTISGTDIADEYGIPVGGTAQTNVKLSDYYAGGSLVSAGTTGNPTNNGTVSIPSTDNPISFSNFFASTAIPQMPAGTYAGRQGTPGQTTDFAVYLEEQVSGYDHYTALKADVSLGIRVFVSTGSTEIQVKRVNTATSYSLWFDTSDVQATLTTSWQTIWSMSFEPDSVRVRYLSVTDTTVDGVGSATHGWSTLSGVGNQFPTTGHPNYTPLYGSISTTETRGTQLESESVVGPTTADAIVTSTQHWGLYFDFKKSGYSDAEAHATFIFKHFTVSLVGN